MTVFTTPAGGTVTATPVAASVDAGVVRMTVDLDAVSWERVRRGQFFHLDADHAGDGFTSPESADRYRLVLRLDEGFDVRGLNDGETARLEERLIADLPEDLTDSESWYAEDVQRELDVPDEVAAPGARLAEGYRTGWAPSGASVGPIFDVAYGWLVEQGMQPTRIDGETVMRLDGDGRNGSWVLWIETREADSLVRVFSSWPEAVPEDRRRAVAELVTRINPDLPVGAFELDQERGQVSFRTGVDLGGDPLTAGVLSRLVGGNVQTFDDHLPALQAVLAGHDAETALRRADVSA